ncbi:MAG: hypothetical protein ACYS29_12360 [Planctomycetota bacterium]|jgi:hypothetical protein
MVTQVLIRDETTAGQITGEQVVEFLTERITVRELIRGRVYQEVQHYNRRQPEYFRGLVQPSEAEKTLNGYKLAKRRQIDWKKQFDMAVEAFEKNGFLILIDDFQPKALDEEVTLKPNAAVSFVKLVPLVGG